MHGACLAEIQIVWRVYAYQKIVLHCCMQFFGLKAIVCGVFSKVLYHLAACRFLVWKLSCDVFSKVLYIVVLNTEMGTPWRAVSCCIYCLEKEKAVRSAGYWSWSCCDYQLHIVSYRVWYGMVMFLGVFCLGKNSLKEYLPRASSGWKVKGVLSLSLYLDWV